MRRRREGDYKFDYGFDYKFDCGVQEFDYEFDCKFEFTGTYGSRHYVGCGGHSAARWRWGHQLLDCNLWQECGERCHSK